MKISEERLTELAKPVVLPGERPLSSEELIELVRGYRANEEIEAAIVKSYAGSPADIVSICRERGFMPKVFTKGSN